MSVSVDPRLAARRQEVQESWARRRLRWIVGLVAVVILGGIVVGLTRSSWLAVRTITVAGANHVDVEAVLAAHDVYEGVPTISIRDHEIERSLYADPWVAQADVVVTWPGTVEVTVLERTPAAWARGSSGWLLLSADGTVLRAGTPPKRAARLAGGVGSLAPGATVEGADAVGALEFLALLPREVATGASAELTVEGIEVTLRNHLVLAGNHRDIPAKVAALVAMLDQGVEPGWTINLISPERPAALNPQPVVEGRGEDVSSSDD